MSMTTNNKDLNAENSNIIFEAGDLDKSTELILFEKDGQRFQLHLWCAETDQSLIINLDKADLVKLEDAIYPFVSSDE